MYIRCSTIFCFFYYLVCQVLQGCFIVLFMLLYILVQSYNICFYVSWNTRGILWISVLRNRSGVAQLGPRRRHCGGLPEASTYRPYNSKELPKLLLKFFYSANIREVNCNAPLIPNIKNCSSKSNEVKSCQSNEGFLTLSKLVCTVARRILMATCGTRCWGRSWTASCAPAGTAFKNAGVSRVPTSIHANIP